MNRKGLIYGILVVLVLSIGVSYAYFTGVITGEGKKFRVSAKELKVVFTDTSEIADTEITPGWEASKTFTIHNESGRPFNYNIVVNDLINTFKTDGNLQYKITSTNGYNMEDYKDIPKSETEIDAVLEYDIDINTDDTHEYTIYFRYKNSTEDQSADMGEIFGGSIGIAEGTINPNVFYSVTLNVTNGNVTDENPKETLKRGVVEFNVEATEGYNLGNNVICDNEAVGTIIGGKVTISNVKTNTICTLNSDIKIYNVEIVVNNGTSEELNRLVEHNSSGTFTISPNTGYTLVGANITGEGCTIEKNIVTASNVTSDRTCEVTLVKEKYNVYLTGNITTTSPKLVEYLGETTFNITPQEGYELESTNINCNNGATASREGNVVTVSNITTETTCTISTRELEYEVTLSVVNGTGSSKQTITHGSSGTFSIGANTGYNLTNPDMTCIGSATPSINGNNVTISNVKGVQTCTVTLKQNEYNLQVTSNNNTYGTVSPTSGKIKHGSNVEITITPASGYKYSSNTCGVEPVNNKITLSNVTKNITCEVVLKGIAVGKTLYSALTDGEIYRTIKTRNDFSGVLGETTATTRVVYRESTWKESGKSVYYFAGNVSDNWVSFGGFYWRIIRTNEDGSVRLLYTGLASDKGNTTTAYILSNIPYNNSSNDAKYVGWMYGSSGRGYTYSSRIKTSVENWYNNNICKADSSGKCATNGYDQYVSKTAIYCNDRGTTSTNSDILYGAYDRLKTNKRPTYKCNQKIDGSMYSNTDVSDKFTAPNSSSIGNQKLTYPVALMTADEHVYI